MFFLLIWGFRNKVETLAMLPLACRNGHTAAHRLVKVRRRFTLFWIPLFTVRTTYFTTCAQCGLNVPWAKEDAERAAATAAAAGVGPAQAPFDPVSAPVPQVGHQGHGALAGAESGLPGLPQHEPAPPTPAGWYPDPAGGDGLRWWDGRGWTADTHQVAPPQ